MLSSSGNLVNALEGWQSSHPENPNPGRTTWSEFEGWEPPQTTPGGVSLIVYRHCFPFSWHCSHLEMPTPEPVFAQPQAAQDLFCDGTIFQSATVAFMSFGYEFWGRYIRYCTTDSMRSIRKVHRFCLPCRIFDKETFLRLLVNLTQSVRLLCFAWYLSVLVRC